MSLKKSFTIILCVFLAALSVYFLISCTVTLVIAHTQPYLMSDSERYDFLGQYIMSALEGIFFLACAVLSVLLIKRIKRKSIKENTK